MSPRPDINRRDFLKLSGLTGLTLGGLALPPGLLPEKGSPESLALNRAKALKRLLILNIKEPGDQSLSLLGSWLEFQAAEFYLDHQGDKLAAFSIAYYLFGNGQQRDITSYYQQSLLPPNLPPDQVDQILADHFSQTFCDQNPNPIMAREKKELMNRLNGQSDPDIKFRFWRAVYLDLFENSLGNYTISLNGHPADVRRPGTSYQFQLKHPHVVVYDIYDFDPHALATASGLSLAQTLSLVATKAGFDPKQLKQILPSSFNNYLTTHGLYFYPNQAGPQLEKAGLAQKYECQADFFPSRPLTLNLDPNRIVQAPTT